MRRQDWVGLAIAAGGFLPSLAAAHDKHPAPPAAPIVNIEFHVTADGEPVLASMVAFAQIATDKDAGFFSHSPDRFETIPLHFDEAKRAVSAVLQKTALKPLERLRDVFFIVNAKPYSLQWAHTFSDYAPTIQGAQYRRKEFSSSILEWHPDLAGPPSGNIELKHNMKASGLVEIDGQDRPMLTRDTLYSVILDNFFNAAALSKADWDCIKRAAGENKIITVYGERSEIERTWFVVQDLDESSKCAEDASPGRPLGLKPINPDTILNPGW